MPKKIAVIDYQKCKPESCQDGICLAVSACQKRTLKQEAPYEQPEPPIICVGCGTCVQACDQAAIILL